MRSVAGVLAVAAVLLVMAVPDGTAAQSPAVTVTFDTGAESKGLAAGDVDPQFTWNHTGDYTDPRYTTRVFNRQNRPLWLGREKTCSCVMADGACWKDTYAPDVPPTMPPYDGVEYLYFAFSLPADATAVKLDVASLGADDRVVLLVNGNEIGGFASRVSVPTTGAMTAGDGAVSTHTFRTTAQYSTVDDPTLFKPGDLNVLTFWVNNTASLDLSAPARRHMGDSDVSLLTAHGEITYEREGEGATPTATSSPTAEVTPTPAASATSTPPAPTPATCVCDFVRERVPPAVVNDAVANPANYYGWQMLLNPGVPPGPANPRRECLSMANPNVPFHPLWNRPIWRVGCP